jgi:hypothetical protein
MAMEASGAIHRIGLFDLGGNTKRVGIGVVGDDKRVGLINLTTTKNFAVHSGREMIDVMHMDLYQLNMAGIKTVVVSIASPMKKGVAGVIETFTNQPLEDEDIPVGRELSKKLSWRGEHVNVVVVNDGDVGTEAEFSPDGVLGNLGEGELGSCIIIGNGVGGRLYAKAGDVLMPVIGQFEPGHWRVNHRKIDELGLPDFEGIPCGCKLTGNRAEHKDVCGEWLTKGPALETFFRLKTGMFDLTNGLALAYLKGEKSLDDRRLQQLRQVLSGEARLLGDMFAEHQTHFEKQIHYALIAGIGKNFGPLMLPGINEAIANYQRSSWVLQPDIRIGNFKSDECNSVGATLIGAKFEASGQTIEYPEA